MEDTATSHLHVVLAMWADGCDYTIDIRQFCDSVLNRHIGADVDLRECLSVLVVVVLHLFCSGMVCFSASSMLIYHCGAKA